ncbi:CRISPR-associated ring nuclease Csm6 [Candidatus Symbiobacter mobilis]|uniref:CRISPR-associated NE0113-family protein n=1 Tax=Candidatus Symbiobacter mobilis CR TaxID=946483 RepID=U5N6E0_9BURK|nr:CRISPR-associated ring nuclease Csm6 [Candidatus Symbiobacter mobilis]AGX86932.1 CRISPR-associated NE0113-family protein [Candidatus Symbiobacter mobilis CR]
MNSYDPHQPAGYPRRVLIAVSGLSPQIVTETIYALAADQDEAFVPTEVHLLTTATGAQRAELSLLSEDLGWFHKLQADFHLPGIAFDRSHIHVMRDAQGKPLGDIRTPADNQAAADFITAQVRAFTADDACALHASIAGGRKTMGFYLGYALSLYGRAQDRLSHVLVSEPFESSYDFFYPTPYSRVLRLLNNQLADSVNAQVTLANIPFVSLRHGLPSALLAGTASFNDTVEAAIAALAPPRLRLHLRGQYIVAGTTRIALPPAELALLAVFARRAEMGKEPLPAPAKGVPDKDWATIYLREYRRITGNDAENQDPTHRALRKGMDGEYFSIHKSRLHKTLKNTLGPSANAYLIADGGTRPRLYQLALNADAIAFEETVV